MAVVVEVVVMGAASQSGKTGNATGQVQLKVVSPFPQVPPLRQGETQFRQGAF